MKNILLATDFSANAQHAATFAGELCYRTGGRLVIFHALSPLAIPQEDEVTGSPLSAEEIAQKKLDALAHQLHNNFGISVSRLLKPGFAEDEIPELARALKAELLIMGSQGEHFRADRHLGHLSKELLKNSDFPVVCVPPEHLWKLPHQIVEILGKKEPLCNAIGTTLLTELKKHLTLEKH